MKIRNELTQSRKGIKGKRRKKQEMKDGKRGKT